MPGIGGRLGWNEPPPAAITITLASNTLPPSVLTRNNGSPMRSIDSTISLRWKLAPNGLICSISSSTSPCAEHFGIAGNVVDRLFRIKLGALAAHLVEDVDQVRLHVEQAELEHREQPDRAGANDQHVSLDGIAHKLRVF